MKASVKALGTGRPAGKDAEANELPPDVQAKAGRKTVYVPTSRVPGAGSLREQDKEV
jgi:hypothetical protein